MLKVLIADDDEIICKVIYMALKDVEEVEEIWVATDAKKEIEIIKNFKPDVVITDIVKGKDESGLDIIKQFHEEEFTPIFIIISSLSIEHEIKLYNLNKVRIRIPKPFRVEKIVQEIKNIEKELHPKEVMLINTSILGKEENKIQKILQKILDFFRR